MNTSRIVEGRIEGRMVKTSVISRIGPDDSEEGEVGVGIDVEWGL